MSIKLLAILSGVVALCAAPMISNTSHSVQINTNSARVARNNAVIETTNRQDGIENRDRPSLRDRTRRLQPRTEPTQPETIATSYSVQETSLDLDIADLRDPYTLTVRPSGGAIELKGTIKLNGKTLKTLSKGTLKLNLSPYLRRGRQKLEIFGTYRPVGASVEIALEGPSAETSQEVGGSGTINQIILINVK